MHFRLKLNKLLATFCLILAFSGCDKQAERKHTEHEDLSLASEYACPMGCEGTKTYDKPGNCPVCGMRLTQVEEGLIQAVSPSRQVLSRQRTVKLDSAVNSGSASVKGIIKLDENRNKTLSSKLAGRIEKLFVTYEYQEIRAGDPVMELYSPELNGIFAQHLELIRSRSDDRLIEDSRSKLRLLGVSDEQLKNVEKANAVPRTITIYSESSGFVMFDSKNSEMSAIQDEKGGGSGMQMQGGPGLGNAKAVSSARIRQGSYVNAGDALFTVNDLKTVWAVLSVPTAQIGHFREGDFLEVISELRPEQPVAGKVIRLERSFADTKQLFAQVRVSLPNPHGQIKLNSLVTANPPLLSDGPLSVPSSAVLRTGMETHVWVKTGETKAGTGIFQVRRVVAGPSISGRTSILSGLAPREEIALSAGLMTDQETFLKYP